MKNLHFFPPLLLIISLVIISSCSELKKDFSFKQDGDIWFRNSGIELKFDKNMYCQVYYKSEENSLNDINPGGELSKPTHFIVVDGEEVKDFIVDYNNLKPEPVITEFGNGRRLVLKGIANGPKNSKIEKTLTVELYDRYPDVAITYAEYKNLGSADLTINKNYCNYFRLDASSVNADDNPYDFWSFQGASIAWGLDYIMKINNGFKQDNWMGVQPETKTGGGVPLVDLWNDKTGMAICHIETKPQLVSLPVEVEADKKVKITVLREKNIVFAPQENYKTLKTAVITHSLDYFDPLNTYSKLMADLGVEQKEPSEEAHEAIWCGWGYLTDFTLDDIYGTLPKLKELGIKWVVIDDRWWDKYGDWNPRDYTFPGGEKQVKEFVDSLHNQGFKVKVWWAPTPVQPEKMLSWGGSVDPGMAQVAKDHPDWLIMDKEGNYPRDCREMYQFCPCVPEVQEYMKQLTTKFIKDWGFDGHKLDAYYVVPPCYNPEHNHKYPGESYEDLPKMLKAIYETSKSIKPYSVTEICNCGVPQDFFQSIYIDQPVTSDPTSVEQSRRRVKLIKALWGPDAPAYTDHVEHIRLEADMNDKSDTAKVGQDFATSMGPGGVIGTKFTWPGGPENMQLTGDREKHWQKWFKLYNEKMLSKGNYLNLYDIIYDKPESHVINKGENYYYAFYADNWKGSIELRGLADKEYRVYDYVNEVELGTVKGPVANITPEFKEYLLIECVPVK
ncbi:MAG: alpha-galactosidase [Bacteroidetes bacterium]|nr:alpha-galactosidase [Bacteroidota bacterium]